MERWDASAEVFVPLLFRVYSRLVKNVSVIDATTSM